jgi:hypothetical protein
LFLKAINKIIRITHHNSSWATADWWMLKFVKAEKNGLSYLLKYRENESEEFSGHSSASQL